MLLVISQMLSEAVKQDFLLFQTRLAGMILSEVVLQCVKLDIKLTFFSLYMCVVFVCKLTIIIKC